MGDEIRKELKIRDRPISWLAKRIDFDPSNLRKQLDSSYIQHKLLYIISVALEKDFFAIYSQSLNDEFEKSRVLNTLK